MFSRFRIHPFVKDVAALSSSQIIGLFLGFFTGIVAARLLGPENQGTVTVIFVIPGLILTFADLGMSKATSYFLGKRIYDDQLMISNLVFVSLVTTGMGIGIAGLLYYLDALPQKYGWALLAIPLAWIPFQLMNIYGTGVLFAKKRINVLAISSLLGSVVYLVILVPLILPKQFQVAGASLAQVSAAGVSAIYIIMAVRRYGHLHMAFVPEMIWRLLKLGFVYAIALFVLNINYRVDVVILQRLSSANEVGIYSIGVTIAELLWLIPQALTYVNFAWSSASQDSLGYAQKTALVMRLTLLGGFILSLMIYSLAPYIIPLIYGSAYVKSSIVVQAILPGIWMALIFKVLNSDLAGRGRPDAALWVYGLAAILNIILNIWWIPHYGCVGSAWASSVSYSIGAIIYAIVYSRMSRISLSEMFLLKLSDFRKLFSTIG